MGKDSFPLSKTRRVQLGNEWYWRVDHWEAGALRGRLLIAYHLGKGNYVAWLSLERGPKEHAVVLCLEYHGDHPGWHVHTGRGDVRQFATGCTRQRILGIRIPSKGRYHRLRRGYAMGPMEARNIAYRAYRIGGPSEVKDLFG